MNQEGLELEYKREYTEEIKKTIVAFANTSGGKLCIGIADNGEVVGVQNPDEIILKVTNSIRDSIKPDITLFTTCHRETIDEKTIISVKVQKGVASPYYIATKGIRPEGVYVRHGASTVPATETAILKMIKETAGESYEEIRSIKQELTFEYLSKEFNEANIKLEESQMRSLGIIGEDGLYSNLGLLLSDQCVHTIKVAVFQGTTKEIFKDRYEFGGSLFKQLGECYAFIDRNNRTGSEFQGLYRIDMRDYPESAVREALLNSIVHREYAFSGSTLISIFDDRIEFVTIGGLVRGMSKEDMLLGVSILRNKNLANVFYRLTLIEAFGTGIPKIMESYGDNENTPKIETTENAFKITLYNQKNKQENIGNLQGISRGRSEFRIDRNSGNYNSVSEGDCGYYAVYYTAGEQKLIDIFLTKEIIKRADVEEALKISQPMAVKYLKSLLDKGTIVKIGNGKNICYRLR